LIADQKLAYKRCDMDTIEIQELLKKYRSLVDEEILELAAEGRDEFQDGVYDLILEEIKKRGLEEKLDELKRREETPAVPEESGEELVTVGEFAQGIESHIVKSKLESEGIEVFLANEFMVSGSWVNADIFGKIKLQVRSSDLEKAREILSTGLESSAENESGK